MPQIDIKVTNEDGGVALISQAFNYQYPAPTITGISPSSGPAGTTVVITGTGFRPGLTVIFAGVPAQIVAASATSITAIVPTLP